MSLPREYLWQYNKKGIVNWSGGKKYYYDLSIYNIYGSLILTHEFTMYTSLNVDDDRLAISSLFNLDIHKYALILKNRIQPRPNHSLGNYVLEYADPIPIYDPYYYQNKSFNGLKLGKFISKKQTYDYIDSDNKGDEYLYKYEYGYVSVWSITRIVPFKLPNSKEEIGYLPDDGYEVYITNKRTKCCLKACVDKSYLYIKG